MRTLVSRIKKETVDSHFINNGGIYAVNAPKTCVTVYSILMMQMALQTIKSKYTQRMLLDLHGYLIRVAEVLSSKTSASYSHIMDPTRRVTAPWLDDHMLQILEFITKSIERPGVFDSMADFR